MRVYTIYDGLVEESGPLYEAPNDQVANRMYRKLMEDTKVRPEEYRVLCLGTVDHTKSLITAFTAPVDVTIDVKAEAEVVG